MIQRIWLSAAAACTAALVSACVQTGGKSLEYRFVDPPKGPSAGRDRIGAIRGVLDGPACRPVGNAAVCGRYAMEAGLIYALVERQDIEVENLLRRAFAFDPTCDARILWVNAAAKMAQRRGDLPEATALLSGSGGRCDGTAARYYAAKLDVLSDEENRLRSGRVQLADLAGYNLGNSGIALEDVYTLRVYSFVSNAEFAEAKRLLRDGDSRGIAVPPGLRALVLIGAGGSALLADEANEVRTWLNRQVADYPFGAEVEDLVREAARMESVAAAPQEVVEARIAADPNLTTSQKSILRLRLADEFARLRDEIANIEEARTRIESYGPGLAEAERRFVAAAVAAAFGDGEAEEAREEYKAALRRVSSALERINDAIGDMSGIQDLHAMLVDPEAWLRAAEAAEILAAAAARMAGDDADAAVLRNFAAAVSRALPPGEFFRAWEVNLDVLGFESEPVVRNVRRVVALAKDV